MNEPMTEKELQDLIKLKRYEQPDEGYFDAFLTEFQERQRSEMLKTSARGLFVERVKAWFTHSGGANKVALGAGLACAAAVTVAMTMHFLPKIQQKQQLAKKLDSLPTDVAGSSSEAIMFHVKESNTVSHEVAREQMVPIDFSQPETHAGPRFTTDQIVF